MTSPNLCLSFSAGPCLQAFAASSRVVRYSVIDHRFLQSSTVYLVVLYFMKASDGRGQKRFSRALQYSSMPAVLIYPVLRMLSSWFVHQRSASPQKQASNMALSFFASLVCAATQTQFVKAYTV